MLQIDFLRSVKLEGIQIFNWEESGYLIDVSHYSPYIKGMGVYSFVVEYSIDASEPHHYEQKQVSDKYFLHTRQGFLRFSPVLTNLILHTLI